MPTLKNKQSTQQQETKNQNQNQNQNQNPNHPHFSLLSSASASFPLIVYSDLELCFKFKTLTFMPKKMKLPPLFIHKNPSHHQPSVSSSTRHSWLSCRDQPKTLSFRATPSADLRNSSAEELENVIRGVKTSSDRLFFSPEKSNSILENNAKHSTQENAPTAITIKSRDPYKDFRTSMEEMVKAHDLRNWDLLEELLGCYLMVNEKRNHCYIIRAFVDLVVYSHIVHPTTCSGCFSGSDYFVTSSSSTLHFISSSSITAGGTSSSSSFASKKAGTCMVEEELITSEMFDLH